MTLIYADLTIDLPFVTSKKGRRAILQGIKERLHRMNCSVLDISGEYPKEARIALAFLSTDDQSAKQKIENVERMLQEHYPDLAVDICFEII